jgi:hypothetical protein
MKSIDPLPVTGVVKKYVPIARRIFFQPLMPPSAYSVHVYDKRHSPLAGFSKPSVLLFNILFKE